MNDANKLVSSLYDKMKESINSKAPDITFQLLENDSTLSLNNYKGKVVIINFWRTNCSGCRYQFPELSKLQDKYYDKGLRVIYISNEEKDSIRNYFSKHSTNGIKVLINCGFEENKITYPYQFFAEPSAYLIDKDGIIRDMWLTPEKLEMLEKRIQPYIVLKETKK